MSKEMKKEEEMVLQQNFVKRMINDPRLNSWERGFLISIEKQIPNRDLTEKQLNILNKMKEKYGRT